MKSQYLLLIIIYVSLTQFDRRDCYKHDYLKSKKLCGSTNITRTQVLIIGAGISGLEAARLLKQNGIETLVIEARNRTGGRIWSVESKNGHIFDLGAAWLHGTDGSIPHGSLSNPLWDIVQQAQIRTRNTTVDDTDFFHLSNQTIIKHLDVWYSEYMDYLQETTKISPNTNSLQYYADLFSTMKNFNSDERQAFHSFLSTIIEGNEGIEMNMINAKNFIELTGVYHGAEPVFHDTGFHSIIDYIIKDFQDGDICFDQIVNKINYNQDLTEVHTTNGHIYQAEYVLLTVPLGVLKGRQIEFNPPLPQWKMNAIDRIGYGLMDKVILLWDKPWWNLTNYYFMRTTSTRQGFGFGVNANKWNDRPALICFFIGNEALRIETKLTKEQVFEEVQIALQEMFPNERIPPPIDSYVTKWKSDQFSNGSYSYISQDQTYEDMIYIGEPVAHKLLFLGEATSREFYGYAHGALLSARREVNRLLHIYNLLEDKMLSDL